MRKEVKMNTGMNRKITEVLQNQLNDKVNGWTRHSAESFQKKLALCIEILKQVKNNLWGREKSKATPR